MPTIGALPDTACAARASAQTTSPEIARCALRPLGAAPGGGLGRGGGGGGGAARGRAHAPAPAPPPRPPAACAGPAARGRRGGGAERAGAGCKGRS